MLLADFAVASIHVLPQRLAQRLEAASVPCVLRSSCLCRNCVRNQAVKLLTEASDYIWQHAVSSTRRPLRLCSDAAGTFCVWAAGLGCCAGLECCAAGQHLTSAFPVLQLVERMRQSKFCLMLPGDGASSRRTSEIIMTGCVPVWLGPSYATMPFADVVDYKKSALFFNVSQHRWAAAEWGPICHCLIPVCKIDEISCKGV